MQRLRETVEQSPEVKGFRLDQVKRMLAQADVDVSGFNAAGALGIVDVVYNPGGKAEVPENYSLEFRALKGPVEVETRLWFFYPTNEGEYPPIAACIDQSIYLIEESGTVLQSDQTHNQITIRGITDITIENNNISLAGEGCALIISRDLLQITPSKLQKI